MKFVTDKYVFRAVSSVTSVLFFPIFPWIFQIGIIGLSVSVALYLSTTGDPLYEIRNFNDTCKCESYKVGLLNSLIKVFI